MNATALGIIGLLIFSIGPTLFAFGAALPTFQFLSAVFFLGFLSITAFRLIQRKNICEDWRQPLKVYLFVYGGVAGYNLLYLLGVQWAEPFAANALNYIWPVLLAVLVARLDHRSLDRFQKLAILLSLMGTALIFMPYIEFQPASLSIMLGYLMSILAAFLWAFYSASAKHFNYNAGFLAPVMLMSAVTFLIFHLIFETYVTPSPFLYMVIAVSGLTRFCYALWDHGIRKGNRLLLSALSYFTPLFAIGLLMVSGFLPTHPYIGMAAVLILAACVLTNVKALRTQFSGVKTLP